MQPENGRPDPMGVSVPVTEYRDGEKREHDDRVVAEVPCVLSYNSIAHATMMVSPFDLSDFAVGFSLTEGIVDQHQDIFDLTIEQSASGVELAMRISSRCFNRLRSRRRSLLGPSGCGLCGLESLEMLLPTLQPLETNCDISPALLEAASAHLRCISPSPRDAGAIHTAIFTGEDGTLMGARSDVGRHNAVDKLVGALAKQDASPASGLAMVSSRASFEIIAKCASVGLGSLASVSAPTSMAVRWASDLNMNLIGFVSADRYVVYHAAS
jgi:FdhD protein